MSAIIGGGGGGALPLGGNPGDVLTKHTSLDGDVVWLPPSPTSQILAPVSIGNAGSVGPTLQITSGVNVPAGSAIVYCGMSQTARLDAITAVADDAGNTYTVLAPPGGSNIANYWAYALNVNPLTAGQHITATLGRAGGDGSIGLAFYIPGIKTSGALDVNVNAPDVNAAPRVIASGTRAQNFEILLSAVSLIAWDQVGDYNSLAPFVRIDQHAQNLASQWPYCAAFYAIAAGPADLAATMNNAGSNARNSGAAMISLISA